MKRFYGKPVGNDRERGKITFITKYGLDRSKDILESVIDEAIKEIEKYGEKSEFLKELALYIKVRNK